MAQTSRNRSGDKRQATLNVVAVACRLLYTENFPPRCYTPSLAAQTNGLRAHCPSPIRHPFTFFCRRFEPHWAGDLKEDPQERLSCGKWVNH